MASLSAGTGTSYCAVSSSVFTTSTQSITPISTTYTADLAKINFQSNTYTANFYTAGNSLIQLEGAPRIFFSGETFTNNGDNSKEAITKYGSGILTESITEMTIANALSNPVSYPGSTLG